MFPWPAATSASRSVGSLSVCRLSPATENNESQGCCVASDLFSGSDGLVDGVRGSWSSGWHNRRRGKRNIYWFGLCQRGDPVHWDVVCACLSTSNTDMEARLLARGQASMSLTSSAKTRLSYQLGENQSSVSLRLSHCHIVQIVIGDCHILQHVRVLGKQVDFVESFSYLCSVFHCSGSSEPSTIRLLLFTLPPISRGNRSSVRT